MTVTDITTTGLDPRDLVMPDAATLMSTVTGIAEPAGLSMARTIRVRPAVGDDWANHTTRIDACRPDSGGDSIA